MDNYLNVMNSKLNSLLRPLFENQIFLGFISLIFVMYATRMAPKLPNSVITFSDSMLGRFLFTFLTVFFFSRDVPNVLYVSLIITLIFILIIDDFNLFKLKEDFKSLNTEHFASENYQNCQSYNKSTVFPLINTIENEIADILTSK